MTQNGYGVRWQYVHPDQGDDPRHDPYTEVAMALSAKVMGVLNEVCFQPDWFVESDYQQGLVKINLRSLMGDSDFYTIKIADLECDAKFSLVKRFAGEILERFHLSRGRFDEAEFNAALAKYPLNYRGGGSKIITPG